MKQAAPMDIVQFCPHFSHHKGDFPTGQALAIFAKQPTDSQSAMSAMRQGRKLTASTAGSNGSVFAGPEHAKAAARFLFGVSNV